MLTSKAASGFLSIKESRRVCVVNVAVQLLFIGLRRKADGGARNANMLWV